MDNLKKDLAVIKTILASVMALTGILTIVFSILCLAEVKGISPESALRYIAGISFVACGAVIIVLNLCKESRKVDIREAVSGAVLVGFGIFFMMKEAIDAIRIIVGLILPLIIACVGGAILLKGGVVLLTLKKLNEEEKKNLKIKGVLLVFFGAILLIIGILLCVFYKNDHVYNVIWLIAGLIISTISLIALVTSAKDLKKVLKGNKKDKSNSPSDKSNVPDAEIKEIETENKEKKDEAVPEVKDN